MDNCLSDASNLLFANLEDYIQDDEPTKSNLEDYVPLSSLIDFEHEASFQEGDLSIRENPFLSNSENIFYCHSDEKMDIGEPVSCDSLMVLKKFLVTQEDSNSCTQYVATMLADYSYFEEYGIGSISYLNKPNFTGVIIFSDLDGTYDSVYQYKDGLVISSRLINRYIQTPDSTATVLCRVEESETKIASLDAAYCVAVKKPQFLSVAAKTDGPSFGSQTPEEGSDGGKQLHEGGINPNKITYTITLSSKGNGKVSGGGTYTMGTVASIRATAVSRISFFSYWSGSFRGRGPEFCTTVEKDYHATANFCNFTDTIAVQPCKDTTKNVANMLTNMSIAPSGGWNYAGGTYGDKVRSKIVKTSEGTNSIVYRKHTGYDFAADIGTPIFAQYDGTVGEVKDGCPSGNNGADGYMYNGKYGNSIRIKTKIGNDDLEFFYAHLNYGNPIAINPRTGVAFKEGDAVYSGDIIGYSGKSGNAYDDKEVPCKHVHWEVRKNGTRIDGKDYINGKVDKSTGKITGIKCD